MREKDLEALEDAPLPECDSKWFEYGDEGLLVKIRRITSEEISTLLRRSKDIKFVKHQQVDEFDNVKFNVLLADAVVLDWRGMTAGLFAEYALLPIEQIASVYEISADQAAGATIPFSQGALRLLGKRCFGFWRFVNACATGEATAIKGETKN